MEKRKEKGKIGVLFRILEIFQAYKEISAGRILEILVSEGYFSENKKDSAKRRLLNYYLSELERLGYIELIGRGRAAKWVLKRNLIKDDCFLIEDQKALMLLGILLSEDIFVRSTAEDLKKLLTKFDIETDLLKHLSGDIGVKNLWGLNFEKFLPLISKILEAIRRKSYISVLFKNENNYRKFLPIGLGARAGFLYLIALEETGDRRYLPLETISYVAIKEQKYKGKKYPYFYPYMCFPHEKAFVFGLEINERLEVAKNVVFSNLIFHYELEGELLRKVYLIGFTGDYFAGKFVQFAAYKILPPDEEMLKVAARKEVDKKFSTLSTDLKENRNRFTQFLRGLKKALDEKSMRVAALLENGFN